jgi:hypothetical protein
VVLAGWGCYYYCMSIGFWVIDILIEPLIMRVPFVISTKIVLFFCLNVHDEHSHLDHNQQDISCRTRRRRSSHAFPFSP